MIYFVVWGEASEYIFSYRVAVKNGIILNEKYYFSPSMINANLLKQIKHPYKKCEITHQAKSEKALLNDYKAKILECFFNWGVRLEDRSEVSNLKGKSLTFLAIPPTRIRIEYASGIATLYALVQETKNFSIWDSIKPSLHKPALSPKLEDLTHKKESEDEISHRGR